MMDKHFTTDEPGSALTRPIAESSYYDKASNRSKLFLVFINDLVLVSDLAKEVNDALYAYDLVLWSKAELTSTGTYMMQWAWSNELCVTINKEKSSTTMQTLSRYQVLVRKKKIMQLSGVPFDKRQKSM